MKSLVLLLLRGFSLSHNVIAQVAINTSSTLPDASSILDITSVTRGLLIPRMSYLQRTEIASPAHALLIYQTDKIPGFYYNSGPPASPEWLRLGDLLLPYSGNTSVTTPAFMVSNLGPGDGIKSVATSSGKTGIISEAPNQAILGNATAASGAAYGVQGISASVIGSGVTAFGSSATGLNSDVSNYLSRIRHSSNGSGGFYLYDATTTASNFLYGDGSSYINSGYLGIRTTAPTQMLDVNGGARIRGLTTGTITSGVYRTADVTLITGSSDIRLKENIQPLQNSLSKVLQLKGVSFIWKADPQKKRSIGFIAQDFEKVIPELGFTNENDGYKGINYAEVKAVLVEAVKELKKENDNLRARLEKIEKRNE